MRLWVDVAEITASLAVVATLGILIRQISESNEIEQAQATLRQAQWDAQLFLVSAELPGILAKIKAVDGHDLQHWMDKYESSYAEAASWNRWLTLLWKGMETDFLLMGPNEQLDRLIENSVNWPDQAFSVGTPFFNNEFAAHVRGLTENSP